MVQKQKNSSSSPSEATLLQSESKVQVVVAKLSLEKQKQPIRKKVLLRMGDLCTLKITALGNNNIGIDEYSYAYSIFVPFSSSLGGDAQLGSTIEAKIVKIQLCKLKKTVKFAVAKLVSIVAESQSLSELSKGPELKAGDKLKVTISHFSHDAIAIAKLENNYKIFVINSNPSVSCMPRFYPSNGGVSFASNSVVGNGGIENSRDLLLPGVKGEMPLVEIQITRMKAKYAFAKVINNVTDESTNSYTSFAKAANLNNQIQLVEWGWKSAASEAKATNDILGSKLRSFATTSQPSTFKKVALINKSKKYKSITSVNSFDCWRSPFPSRLIVQETRKQETGTSGVSSFAMPMLAASAKHNKGGKDSLESLNIDSLKGSSSPIFLDTWIKEGNKFTVILPTKVKQYVCLPNYIVMKFSNTVFFIKLALGATLGNRVKIKLTKVLENLNLNQANELSILAKPAKLESSHLESDSFSTTSDLIKIAIAKVIAINPISLTKKRILIKSTICKMLKNGMHFGERAVKCNARMKNYVWLRQKGQNKNKPLIKRGCNIINLLKTRRCLNKSLSQLSKYAAKGRTFLFVGTKKPAAALIARASLVSKTSFFVNTRWLGGMLTNWKTILKSIAKITPILKEKQTVVKEILTKRQNLKSRLISKAILLKKKSRILLKKGQNILKIVSNVSNLEQNKAIFKETNEKLTLRTQQLIAKSAILLQTRSQLLLKKQQLRNQSSTLQANVDLITDKYKVLINQITANRQRLIELKSLFVIAKQIQKIKKSALTSNTNLLTLCYAQFKKFNNNSMVIPNPPTSILNKIVGTIRDFDNVKSSATNQSLLNETNLTRAGQSQKTGNMKTESLPEKIVLVSGLISKFSLLVPQVRECIKVVSAHIVHDMQKIKLLKQALENVKQKINLYAMLKGKINIQLNKLKISIFSEAKTLSVVKRKLKQLTSEIRLLKFLPKLRYLPTPYSPIYNTVQVLMKKIVDPKLKYPMNLIYDKKLSLKSKKVVAARKKTWQRLEKYFGGIANMTKMKSNKISKNVAILVGQKEEQNAVRECKKLGIKMFSIIDSNCDPSLADYIVPANDDSRNSIKYILTKFITQIRLAQKLSLNVKKLARLTK